MQKLKERMISFRQKLLENNLDGAIIYSKENRRYLSGFTGSTGYFIVSASGKAAFITDFRYKEQAKIQCKDSEIIIHENALNKKICETVEAYGIKKLGIEDNFMTVGFYSELKQALPEVELSPLKDIMDLIRMIKNKEEIECIGLAASIADAAFSHILGFIRPGISETDIATELEYFMKKKGSSGFSFEPIVASGTRSALPHGIASNKIINNGEFLTLDFGCVYNGYCSDMTRTVFVGQAKEEHRKIYAIVLQAQEEALRLMKPGALTKDIDKAARDIIKDAGYGEYFGHGLGHGVGLAVHEEPRLSVVSEKVLVPNMIVTDEPGIYIPGFGGVRIEDLVLITPDGNKTLSKSPKHLISL